jgi:hypothetical protein
MKYIANPVIVDVEEITAVFSAGASDQVTSYAVLLGNGQRISLSYEMTARYEPKVGDYIVTQEDGYVYLNPKAVLERKYRPLEN